MNHLQQITKRAKAIQKAKPSIKWTDAIKKASAEYRAKNKTVGTRSVGGAKKATTKKKVSSKPITVKYNETWQQLIFSDGTKAKVDYDGGFNYKGKYFDTIDHTSEKDLIRDLKKAFPSKTFKWVSGVNGTLLIKHKVSGAKKPTKKVGATDRAFRSGETITGLSPVVKNRWYFAKMTFEPKTYKAFHSGDLLVKYLGSYGGLKRFEVYHDARDLKQVKPAITKKTFVMDLDEKQMKKSHFIPTDKPSAYLFKMGYLKLNL